MPCRVLLLRLAVGITILSGVTGSALAQPPADTTRRTAPNSDLPLIPTRPLKFTTDEGTWMSLDVSPDGEDDRLRLVRRHLHDSDRPAGSATRITSGSGFDGQPRFSPDGKSIVFVSDRSGSENLWLVDPDGQHVRALTRGPNQRVHLARLHAGRPVHRASRSRAERPLALPQGRRQRTAPNGSDPAAAPPARRAGRRARARQLHGRVGRRRTAATSTPARAPARPATTRCWARPQVVMYDRQTGRARATHAEPRHGVPPGREPRRQVARLRVAAHGGHRAQAPRARVRRREVARRTTSSATTSSRAARATCCPATPGRPTRRRS